MIDMGVIVTHVLCFFPDLHRLQKIPNGKTNDGIPTSLETLWRFPLRTVSQKKLRL